MVQGTKRDARLALARFELEVGVQPDGPAPGTLSELLYEWLDLHDLSELTRVNNRAVIRKHVDPTLGRIKVERLAPRDLDRFYRALTRDGLSPAYVLRIHTMLSSALAQAVKWGLHVRNPARDATPPRPPVRRPEAPTPTEVRQLLEVTDGPFGRFLLLAATTGARRGELCGLRWEAVDLKRRTLTVRAAVFRAGRSVGEKHTKTGRERTLALPAVAVEALREQRRHAAELGLAVGVPPSGYVFSQEPDGSRPWPPDYVTHRFIKLRRQAGVDFRLHDLRHFTATQMLGAGIPVETVSKHLGHARTSTTQDVYGSSLSENERRAAEVMGGVFG
jgi:integrase